MKTTTTDVNTTQGLNNLQTHLLSSNRYYFKQTQRHNVP